MVIVVVRTDIEAIIRQKGFTNVKYGLSVTFESKLLTSDERAYLGGSEDIREWILNNTIALEERKIHLWGFAQNHIKSPIKLIQ